MKYFKFPKWYLFYHFFATVAGTVSMIGFLIILIINNRSGAIPFFMFLAIMSPMILFYFFGKEESIEEK